MKTKTRKKKKIDPSVVLFAALLANGLGELFYPTLSDLYTRYQIRQEINRYNKVMEAEQADYSDLWEAAEEYNRSLLEKANPLVADQAEEELTYGLLNPNDSNMMGYVEIPVVNVELPIYRGTEEKQLQAGAGWWIGSSLPTGGESTHCVITAHTGLARAKMFTDLDRIETGDRFMITVLDRVMTYEVDQILVTEPEDIEPLQIEEGKDYATLYTCTPYGVNTQRLLVRGHRVATEPDEKNDSGWLPQLLFFILTVVLTLLIWFVLKRKRRGRHEDSKKSEGENDVYFE